MNFDLFAFAVLIYLLFMYFPLQVRQLYWQLDGHAIAVFSFQVYFISASSSPAVLGLDFCLPGIKEIPAGCFVGFFFGNAIIYMHSNLGNVVLA